MKRVLRPVALLGLVVAAPLLAACGSSAGSAGTQVVAAFYPLQYVAERIAGDTAEVEGLASPGVEPHDLELTLQQTAAIADADVVVYSRGFQPAVDSTVDENASGRVVDAAQVAQLTPTGTGTKDDPHFWLDPTRLAAVAGEVKRQLVDADPDHAGVYEKNLVALTRDLDRLDRDFADGLADCERRTLVVSHDAFGYLGDRYDLDVHAINGLSPDAEPSPAHIRELSDLIESEGISTVFSETLASPAMADTLAHDLGLRTAVLDPVEGLADGASGDDYLSLMRENLAAIQEANGCR